MPVEICASVAFPANLGLLLSALLGAGTPQSASRGRA